MAVGNDLILKILAVISLMIAALCMNAPGNQGVIDQESAMQKRKKVIGNSPAASQAAAREAMKTYWAERAMRDDVPVKAQLESAPDPEGSSDQPTSAQAQPPPPAEVVPQATALMDVDVADNERPYVPPTKGPDPRPFLNVFLPASARVPEVLSEKHVNMVKAREDAAAEIVQAHWAEKDAAELAETLAAAAEVQRAREAAEAAVQEELKTKLPEMQAAKEAKARADADQTTAATNAMVARVMQGVMQGAVDAAQEEEDAKAAEAKAGAAADQTYEGANAMVKRVMQGAVDTAQAKEGEAAEATEENLDTIPVMTPSQRADLPDFSEESERSEGSPPSLSRNNSWEDLIEYEELNPTAALRQPVRPRSPHTTRHSAAAAPASPTTKAMEAFTKRKPNAFEQLLEKHEEEMEALNKDPKDSKALKQLLQNHTEAIEALKKKNQKAYEQLLQKQKEGDKQQTDNIFDEGKARAPVPPTISAADRHEGDMPNLPDPTDIFQEEQGDMPHQQIEGNVFDEDKADAFQSRVQQGVSDHKASVDANENHAAKLKAAKEMEAWKKANPKAHKQQLKNQKEAAAAAQVEEAPAPAESKKKDQKGMRKVLDVVPKSFWRPLSKLGNKPKVAKVPKVMTGNQTTNTDEEGNQNSITDVADVGARNGFV